jgi:hypothetical protein
MNDIRFYGMNDNKFNIRRLQKISEIKESRIFKRQIIEIRKTSYVKRFLELLGEKIKIESNNNYHLFLNLYLSYQNTEKPIMMGYLYVLEAHSENIIEQIVYCFNSYSTFPTKDCETHDFIVEILNRFVAENTGESHHKRKHRKQRKDNILWLD